MILRSWIRKLFQRPVGRRLRKGAPRVSLAVEGLESRWVLSTITVNTLLDNASDSNISGSTVTLREAINYANSQGGNQTIQFAANLSGTIVLTQSELQLTDPGYKITISGAGANVTVSGDNASRVFEVGSGSSAINTNVEIDDLTLTDGNGPQTPGGGLGAGGGILVDAGATLVLNNSTISGSTASFGGGIDNIGTLTINNSTISGNKSSFGAGIDNSQTLTVDDSTLSGNSGTFGGAIDNTKTLTVNDSTFSGNSATYGGGIDNSQTLTVNDSTFSGNTASAGDGTALDIGSTSSATLTNTIVADAIAGTLAGSSSYNLVVNSGAGSTGGLTNGSNGNLVVNSVSALDLSTLSANGGPTATLALLPGSPAIHAGDSGLLPSGVTTDQRGAALDIPLDVGAFQTQSPIVVVKPVNITYGTALANSQLSGTATYTVNGSTVQVSGTYSYTSAAGTTLGAGNGQLESVTFQPTGTTNYSTVLTTVTVNVAPAVPVFSALSSPSIAVNTPSIVLSGNLAAGSVFPTNDTVSITLNGVTQTATVGSTGNFSTTFTTGSLAIGSYGVTYAFAGDNANFAAAANGSGTLTVAGSGAALEVGTDAVREGTWEGVYGSDGYDIADLPSNIASLPSYAQVTFTGQTPYVWNASTSDVRGLQQPGSSSRLASTWYAANTFTVNVNLTDGQTHEVALYLLDWDKSGRSERVDVINPSTGNVLATQNVSGFSGGEYLVFDVTGDVEFKFTNTGPQNAVLSGLFFGSQATLTATDTTHQGTWQGTYGADGYSIADAPSNIASLPAYAQVTFNGQGAYVWNASTSDVRALQVPGASSRLASTLYAAGSFTATIDLTDGKSHEVALYFLDWDKSGRSETVSAIDPSTGNVLATQNVSGFSGGEYLVFNLTGDVEFKFTNTGPQNAVLSGLFFGGAPTSGGANSASLTGTDATHEGSWQGIYGVDGYTIADTPSNIASLPTYAQVSFSGQSTYVWNAATSDVRALQVPGSSSRLASTLYAASSFTATVDLTDGKTHEVALYLLDWDKSGRTETVSAIDPLTGNVLATQNVSGFSGGEYLVFNVTGDVEFKFTNTGPQNAVLSGLFFGGGGSTTSSASLTKTDTTDQGTWEGTYGKDGYSLAGGPSSLPAYAQTSLSGQSSYVWNAATSDVRALQDPGTSSRLAGCWYSPTSFSLDVNLTDGQTHQVALYLLDWDHMNRSERVDVIDPYTGATLLSQSVSAFSGGEYLVFNVTGNVQFKFTNTGSASQNAVLSGVFFG